LLTPTPPQLEVPYDPALKNVFFGEEPSMVSLSSSPASAYPATCACLPICLLPAYLSAACLTAFLPVYLLVPACLPAYLRLPACLPICLCLPYACAASLTMQPFSVGAHVDAWLGLLLPL
jgi:hypothetical protein